MKNYTDIKHIPKMLLELVKKHKPKSMLDLGCGHGYSERVLNARRLLPERTVALDMDKRYTDEIGAILPQIEVLCGYIENLGEYMGQFELIVLNQVIEHIKNESKVLDIIYDLLEPNGRLFISSIIKRPYALYIYKNKKGEPSICPEHEREYTSLTDFGTMVSESGFNIYNIKKRPFRTKLNIRVPGFFIAEAVCGKT